MNAYEFAWQQLLEDAARLGPDPELADRSTEQLEHDLRTGAAQLAALTCQWLGLVAEFVIRGDWARQGARTPAEWLSWAVGVAPATAREQVRVALRLRELPQVRARFAAGTLSYSKVRAITRIATPDLENLLLDYADGAPAAQLETIIRTFRRTGDRPDRDGPTPGLEVIPLDDGLAEVRLRTRHEDVTVLLEHLDRLAELATPSTPDAPGPADPDDLAPPDTPTPSLPQRRMQAVLDAVAAAVAAGPADTSGLDRHLRVLQVAAAEVTHDPHTPTTTAPRPDRPVPVVTGRGRHLTMSPRVLRRLICDADVLTITTDDHGTPLDVGRASRAATAAQRRALRLRDRTCRFPGCHTTRHLHAHHVIEWTDDGPTDLDNLILLCSHHHRLVHDHHWHLHPIPGHPGRYTFHPPDTPRPHPADLPRPGVSAETPTPPDHHDPHALQPPWWYGDYDLDLAIAVLQEQTGRLATAA